MPGFAYCHICLCPQPNRQMAEVLTDCPVVVIVLHIQTEAKMAASMAEKERRV